MDKIGLSQIAGAYEGESRPFKSAYEPYAARVKRKIKEHEARLVDLRRMQEIFDKHPDFEELLSLVQRNGRI